MKSIETLIKINTSELDELRKVASGCEDEIDKLIFYNNKMEAELEMEHAFVTNNPQMGLMFTNYKTMIRQRQANIEEALRDIENRLEYLKEQIAMKFNDVKKYEILLSTKLEELRKKELADETKQLNEIAINNYLKNAVDS
jgi:flagellar export protein FliJ